MSIDDLELPSELVTNTASLPGLSFVALAKKAFLSFDASASFFKNLPFVVQDGDDVTDAFNSPAAHYGDEHEQLVRFRNNLISAPSLNLMNDSFWWFLSQFKSNSDEIRHAVFERMSMSFVQLFNRVNLFDKDHFFDHYYDAAAYTVFNAFWEAFPHSRAQFDYQFKSDLLTMFSRWVCGTLPRKIKGSHWTKQNHVISTGRPIDATGSIGAIQFIARMKASAKKHAVRSLERKRLDSKLTSALERIRNRRNDPERSPSPPIDRDQQYSTARQQPKTKNEVVHALPTSVERSLERFSNSELMEYYLRSRGLAPKHPIHLMRSGEPAHSDLDTELSQLSKANDLMRQRNEVLAAQDLLSNRQYLVLKSQQKCSRKKKTQKNEHVTHSEKTFDINQLSLLLDSQPTAKSKAIRKIPNILADDSNVNLERRSQQDITKEMFGLPHDPYDLNAPLARPISPNFFKSTFRRKNEVLSEMKRHHIQEYNNQPLEITSFRWQTLMNHDSNQKQERIQKIIQI